MRACSDDASYIAGVELIVAMAAALGAWCRRDPMLRQLLVGTAVSVCNIAIHALVMATVVQISSRIARAKHTVQQSLRLTTVVIATASIATVPVSPVLTQYISLS
jgi:hypothetical protein